MKQPLLVGLNDNTVLNSNAMITNLQSCMEPLNTNRDGASLDIPPSYKNLWLGESYKVSPSEFKVTASMWAALYGVHKGLVNNAIARDNFLAYSGIDKNYGTGLDLDNFFYQQLVQVPIFTDEYYNKIFIHVADNPHHKLAWEKGWFGSINKNDFEYITFKHDTQGAGWLEKIPTLFSIWDKFNVVKLLEKVGVGSKKLNKPVLLYIERDSGTSFSEYVDEITWLQVAVQVAGAIFGFETKQIVDTLEKIKEFAINPDTILQDKEVQALMSSLQPVLLEVGGANIQQYLEPALQAKMMYENKDYVGLGKLLGISGVQASKLNETLADPSMTELYLSQSAGKSEYNYINGILQHLRNFELVEVSKRSAYSSNTGANTSELNYFSDKYHTLGKGNEALAYMTMVAGGGHAGTLPTKIGSEDVLMNLYQRLNINEKTPALHAQLMKASLGLPTGQHVFDELILLNIEDNIIRGKKKSFTIPAQLPPSKATCITRNLQKYGIDVIGQGWGDWDKVVEPKGKLFKGKTNIRVLRNFK